MNTAKKTKKETAFEKKEKAKCKTMRCDKLEQRERLDALKDVIEHLKHVKNLNGFIVLVDEEEETEDGKHRKRLNACCGNMDILCNLISNIAPDLLEEYERKKKMHDAFANVFSGKTEMGQIDKALEEVFKMMRG